MVHVLIADDDANLLAALSVLLVGLGYSVSTASNGVEALDAALNADRTSSCLTCTCLWLKDRK
jgi:CheY-like chemotaxis protein